MPKKTYNITYYEDYDKYLSDQKSITKGVIEIKNAEFKSAEEKDSEQYYIQLQKALNIFSDNESDLRIYKTGDGECQINECGHNYLVYKRYLSVLESNPLFLVSELKKLGMVFDGVEVNEDVCDSKTMEQIKENRKELRKSNEEQIASDIQDIINLHEEENLKYADSDIPIFFIIKELKRFCDIKIVDKKTYDETIIRNEDYYTIFNIVKEIGLDKAKKEKIIFQAQIEEYLIFDRKDSYFNNQMFSYFKFGGIYESAEIQEKIVEFIENDTMFKVYYRKYSFIQDYDLTKLGRNKKLDLFYLFFETIRKTRKVNGKNRIDPQITSIFPLNKYRHPMLKIRKHGDGFYLMNFCCDDSFKICPYDYVSVCPDNCTVNAYNATLFTRITI